MTVTASRSDTLTGDVHDSAGLNSELWAETLALYRSGAGFPYFGPAELRALLLAFRTGSFRFRGFHMRRTVAAFFVIAGVVALASAAPAGAVEDAESPSTKSVVRASLKLPAELTPVEELPVQDAMAVVREVVRPYDAVYGGMNWDANAKQVEVFLKGGDAAEVQRAQAITAIDGTGADVLKGVVVVIVTVPLSFEEQQAFLEAVYKSRASWGGELASQHLYEAAVDARTGVVTLQTDAYRNELQAVADKAYPGDRVRVDMNKRPDGVQTGRYSDTVGGLTAGNALWLERYADRSQAQCSQGWNWLRQDGITYASTAGHCWVLSESNVWHISDTQRIGYVAARYWNDNEYIDFETVRITSGSLDATVWVGPRNTTDSRQVVDSDNDGTQTGLTVCTSGANGGLACGAIANRNVVSTAHDPNNNLISTFHLTCVIPSNPAVTSLPGDSGGPWLSTHVGGTVKAWGQHRGRSNACSNGMIFTTVLNISARIHGTLVVQ